MNTRLTLCALLLGMLPAAIAQEAAPKQDLGTFSLDSRLRFETAEQDGREDADNISLRLRPGYTSPEFFGFKAMAEGEFTFVADKDAYNAAGVHGDPNKGVIADPENAQLDQLWLSYADQDYGSAKVGRQVITLDNHRWVGHVGWRQNRQTYDAATVSLTAVENLTAFYGYIDKVVRIFGDQAPSSGANAEEFGSESHLVNLKYKACEAATLTAYGYLLELEDAPGKIAGSDTFGLSATGNFSPAEGAKLGYLAEYAQQSDAGDNVQDYQADYVHLNANGSHSGFWAEAGYELLGSDATGATRDDGSADFASVKAPLATLHKFNGFADVFLVTPDKGLVDIYAGIGYTMKLGEFGPLTAKLWYHDFETDEGGNDLGEEIDAVLVKPLPIKSLPGKLTALAKYASYTGPSGGTPDLDRFIVELNYALSF